MPIGSKLKHEYAHGNRETILRKSHRKRLIFHEILTGDRGLKLRLYHSRSLVTDKNICSLDGRIILAVVVLFNEHYTRLHKKKESIQKRESELILT